MSPTAGVMRVAPIPAIPGLLSEFHALAQGVLSRPGTTSDHLLILVDSLDELAGEFFARGWPGNADALCHLADELRRRAPAYAARSAG